MVVRMYVCVYLETWICLLCTRKQITQLLHLYVIVKSNKLITLKVFFCLSIFINFFFICNFSLLLLFFLLL